MIEAIHRWHVGHLDNALYRLNDDNTRGESLNKKEYSLVLTADLDAANARIAELEAENAALRPLAEAVGKLDTTGRNLEILHAGADRWVYHDGRKWRKDDVQPTLVAALIALAGELETPDE
jgi:hypothetical protein